MDADQGITYLYGIDYRRHKNTYIQAPLYDLVFKSTRLKYQRKKYCIKEIKSNQWITSLSYNQKHLKENPRTYTSPYTQD